MKLAVRIESVAMEFDVGETLKRKDDYLHTPYYKGTVREGPDRGDWQPPERLHNIIQTTTDAAQTPAAAPLPASAAKQT